MEEKTVLMTANLESTSLYILMQVRTKSTEMMQHLIER